MRTLILATAALFFGATAQAAPPPPDTLPGTIHFDSGASTVKARPGVRKKHARHTGNATLNRNAMRDGTGKQ